MEPLSDQALVERAKADPRVFGELYDRYYSKISNYILRRVGETAPAQDITSTVFFKAMHGLTRYEWRGLPFSAWLYRIASNEVNDYFRGQRHRPLSLEELQEDYQFEPTGETDLEQGLIAAQEQAEEFRDFRLVRQLMQRLPPKYQEALALRYFEKKPIAEIAQITDINVNTVKSLLARGVKMLRIRYAEAKSRSDMQLPNRQTVIETEEETA